jgi:outer membrane protein OmpA-like peptidoglycan-associated protein
MSTQKVNLKSTGFTLVAVLMMSACSTQMKAPEGSAAVREKLLRLEANADLASQAPIAVKEAEAAVSKAEKPQKDKVLSSHLVWVADRKVDIASALAQSNYLESQRKGISEARESARLDSRTREADNARNEVDRAHQKNEELQRQIAELNAKETERGLVVTLGDLLFQTGRSELRSGTASNLTRLAAFLNEYSDRTVVIEGHTDSIGDENYNMGLSERRAFAVQAFLVAQGVAVSRLQASGKGEVYPVASNDSAAGRQQNRRVEVVIANTLVSQK